METQEITQRLYDSFGMSRVKKDLAKRVEATKSQPEPTTESVDVYQRNQDKLYENSQKSYPKGSSRIVSAAVYSVVDGQGGEGLAHAYKEAKEDVDTLKRMEERERADLRRQQYMQEYFLPAVELVVNSASPDEVLNSKQALADLDEYALLEGSGKGYTAQYIRQAYGNQLGQVKGRSDPSVRSGVQRLNILLDNGEIRSAVGLANKIKSQVDNGEAQADDGDYELISRVIAYYV